MIKNKTSTGTVVGDNIEESSESIVDNGNKSLGTERKINKINRDERRKGEFLYDVLRTHMMKYRTTNKK